MYPLDDIFMYDKYGSKFLGNYPYSQKLPGL